MHTIVKFITNDDGDKHPSSDWHYVDTFGDADRSFCGGEVFGMGESSLQYESKEVLKGGITCPLCLRRIKEIKSLKL